MAEPNPSDSYVRPLADAGRGIADVGGKGESLARLVRAGLPVPDGFHVTTAAYESFLVGSGLGPVISDRLRGLDLDDLDALEAVSTEIRALVEARSLPSEVVNAVRTGYRDLGQGRVAVRSSATVEDLPESSAAGQQDSYLDIGSEDGVLAAIKRCWGSLWSSRAISYRARQQIDPSQVAMAVVVQRMINAEASGVLFTADPITGQGRRLLINASWGLGEAVVGGVVTPDTFTVGRRSGVITSRTISQKSTMTVRAAGGTEQAPVPEALQFEASLTDAQVLRLAGYGMGVADLFGAPVDVEWCRLGEQLYLLQARPISVGSERDPWNDSRRGRFLWTNTNVGEAIPDVMTPATWSMVQVFLSDAMATASIPPYVGYGRIGGRIYLNVSVIQTLSSVVGVSEHRFRDLTAEVFGRLPADVEIPPVKVSKIKVLAAVLPVAAHVISEARRDVRDLDAYLAAHPQLCLQRRAEVAAVTRPDRLARMWRDVIRPEFHKASLMLSAATRSSGASFVTTRKRLQRLVGDAGANAITAGLGGEAGELASLGLLDGLDRLASGSIDRQTFNQTYGHRGPHEFEISLPRPGEDPDWVSRQVAQRRQSGGSYREMLRRQEQQRAAAWRRLEDDHPVQARLLRRQIDRWATISRNREQARSEVIRYFWVLRAYVLRAADLTGLGNDTFFLSAEEIEAVLDGTAPDFAAISARKQAYGRYTALPAYPALILGRFDPFAWAADPNRRTDRYVEGTSEPPERSVSGFPGSAGVVEGVARVINSAGDGAQLRPGEVLVTTVTNVGWTPLFPRAAAVVTDVGAPLSHAAIVARELGIPAVVGCGNATMQIKSGDRVRVDGSAGTVDVLAPLPS